MNLDAALVPLSLGLDSVFLNNRDLNTAGPNPDGVPILSDVSDGKPDLTVNGRGANAPTIASRFDRTQNGGITDTQRWNIPNILRVVTKSYAHRDLGLVNIGSVEGKAVLDTNFTSRWSASNPITPTLMYAFEDNYRALNYSPESQASNGLVLNNGRVTVDLNGTVVQTVAGLSWSPYSYNGTLWLQLDMQSYWRELDRRYANTGDPGDSVQVAGGKVAAAELHYLALNNRLTSMVQVGATPIRDSAKVQSDGDIATGLRTSLIGAKAVVVMVVKQVELVARVESTDLFRYLGYLRGFNAQDAGTQNIVSSLRKKLAPLGNWSKE